jgi:hypothetical protein
MSPSSPWKKSSRTFSRNENLRFSRVLRTRDRIPAIQQAVYPQPASPVAFPTDLRLHPGLLVAVMLGAAVAVVAPGPLAGEPRPTAGEPRPTAGEPRPTAGAEAPAPASGAGPSANGPQPQDSADIARKAEIMGSPRWRRAIFELGEWLSSQSIYTPHQVRNIKADFNRRVERMSASDLEYLLDELDAKFKILETPEAQDARAWVGQYLSVLSDGERARVLKDVPDVVTMSSAQLQQEIVKIEQKRTALQRQQSAFDEGRRQMVEQAQSARQATAQASAAAARATAGAASYSPYRGGGNGSPPFANTGGSGMTLTSGPFGAYVSMNLGGF